MQNSMAGPQEIKNTLAYNPSVPLLGTHPRKVKSAFQRDTCTPMFIAVVVTIAEVWKPPKCPLMDG